MTQGAGGWHLGSRSPFGSGSGRGLGRRCGGVVEAAAVVVVVVAVVGVLTQW